MPAALPILGAVFLSAGAVAATIGTVAAITIAGIGLATILTVTGIAIMAVSMLTMKTPKPASQSQGQQLDLKLDPKAPIPVAYGRTATGGYMVYRNTYGAKNAFLAIIAALSAGPVQAIESHIASDYTINYNVDPTNAPATCAGVNGYNSTSKLYKSKLHMRYQLGDAPANTTATQASGQPLPGSPGKLSGIAHAIQWCEYNQDAFPQGLPKSLWVLRGVKLYDPRKDSTFPGGSGAHRRDDHSTWEFGENPYLAALQWTLGVHWNGKRAYGIGAEWDEIDAAAFVYGANIADQNNWRIGGVVTTSDDKYAVLATILQSGGGVPVPRGAQISVSVNAPKTSVFTLTNEDIVGDIEIQSTTSSRDRKNAVIPSYRDEGSLWEIIAGEAVSVPEFIAADKDQIKSLEIEFPMVQQAAQAHQLAAYELCNSREFLTFKAPCKPRLLNVRVGDAITVTVSEVGAINQKCLVVGREYDPQSFTVNLTLKSETDSKHAYALGQSQVAPETPALTGFDPTQPDMPGENAWTVTGTYSSNGTGVKIPVLVINGANDNPYTSEIIAEYRKFGDSTWSTPTVSPASATKIEVFGVTAGTVYEVAISYRTGVGALSPRRVLSATAGAMEIDWNAGVITGPNKPADNATVGGTIGVDIRDEDGEIWTPAAVDISEIEALIADAKADLQPDIDAAQQEATDARAEAQQARDDLAAEVARAQGAEGTIATTVTQAQTTANGAVTSIATEQTTRANADTALSNRATTLESQMAGTTGSALQSRIATEETTRANAVSAVANRATTLEAQLAGTQSSAVLTRITTEETTRASADTALSNRATTLEAQMAGTQGSAVLTRITTEETTRASADTALSNRATTLESQMTGATGSALQSRIATEETTRATADTALATRSSLLESTLGAASGALNANPAFTVWDAVAGMPSGWSWWVAGSLAKITSPFTSGGFVARATSGAAECGFVQTVTGLVTNNWCVIDVTVGLVSGTWQGSGITMSGSQNFSFTANPDVSGLTSTTQAGVRRWSFLFQTNGSSSFHAMNNWSSFATPVAKTLDWYRVAIRPATAGEIAAQKANADIGTLTARISTEETTRANADTALATRATTLESQLAGGTASNLLSRISTVETVTSNGTFAAASSLSSLSSTVGGLSSTVSTQAGTISTLQGRAAAYWSVSSVAGDGRAQLTVHADANGGGGVDIVGNTTFKGSLNVGPDSGQRCKITNAGMTIYDANNVMRVRVGIW